jgi:alpha-L-fucosidase
MQVGEGSLWLNQERARHRTGEEVWGKLSEVLRQDRNLLLNVGPRGDGSIHPADVAALRAAGERIRRDGFPGSAEGVTIVGAESTTTS